jgi:CubicO group peptidase (beta-lactamase class C family)
MRQTAPILLIVTLAAFGQSVPEAFTSKADAYVQSWARDKLFRGAVLVAKDGKPVLRKAYGNANDEWEIANTPDTKFRLGSITKQFTAVAILQLVEQGKLKLEDPVKTHYPDAPAAWDSITIHHLLNHSSGIPSYTDQPGFMANRSRDPKTPAEVVKLTQDLPLQFTPGEKFRYNNTGYVLLGAILEKITGQSYASYLRKNIFDPLDMKDSGYDSSAEILKKRAQGYEPDGKNTAYIEMILPHAAGSLYSTIDDLLKSDEALYTEKLIKKATFVKMTTPGHSNYGYGLVIQNMPNGKPSQSHGGGVNGFNTFMIRFPEEHLVAIALGNQNGTAPQQIGLSLARIYFGEDIKPRPQLTEVKLPAAKLDDYIGSYQLAPGFILKVTREGDQMFTQATGQPKIKIFASAEDKFFLKVVDAQLDFHREADGKVSKVTLHQNGQDIPGPRIAE